MRSVTAPLPRRRSITLAAIIALASLSAAPRGTIRILAAPAVKVIPSAGLTIAVEKTGLYRVSGSDLKSRGFSWNGVSSTNLTLTLEGKVVPIQVSSGSTLTDASFIEFYGSAARSQYTKRNVYVLRPVHTAGNTVATADATPGPGSPIASFSSAVTESKRSIYEPAAQGDPWVFTTLTAIARQKKDGTLVPEPVGQNVKLTLPGLVTTGQATLTVQLVGITNLGGTGPQHHLVVQVNGHGAGELKFTGYYLDRTLTTTVPASELTPITTLRLLLPDDVVNTYDADQIDIRTFTLKYPRALNAVAGHLTLGLNATKTVRVSGLRDSQVSVWETGTDAPTELTHVSVQPSGVGYAATFAAPTKATYVVSDGQALLHPASIGTALSPTSLLQGSASLLIIAPQAFIKAITPLAAYHQQHGTTVKIASVESVYARFSGGVIDPNAIGAYIKQAKASIGTTAVLLVGGDTYDPLHYLKCRGTACPGNTTDSSFIPSLYTRDDYYGQVPSDELYVGGASGPTVAIGRIPAVTSAQVTLVVDKTLNVLQNGVAKRTAVFAAGDEEPDFQQTSQALASQLPADYSVTDAYIATAGAPGAKAALLGGINGGASLVNYVGHGNLEQWGNPPPLLTVGDVRKLTSSAPGVFLGWGCQTAYHVDPTDLSLNVSLLFQPGSGAFLTLGSTGLDLPSPQAILAKHFYANVFGTPSTVTTIGEALRTAEMQTLADGQSNLPPVESYELFGDPMLPTSLLR
jgi:hypothetical protein